MALALERTRLASELDLAAGLTLIASLEGAAWVAATFVAVPTLPILRGAPRRPLLIPP